MLRNEEQRNNMLQSILDEISNASVAIHHYKLWLEYLTYLKIKKSTKESIETESKALNLIVSATFFEGVWFDILSCSSSSETLLHHEASQFTMSYRTISNYYRNSSLLGISQNGYNQILMESLLNCLAKLPKTSGEKYATVISSLSSDFQSIILNALITDDSQGSFNHLLLSFMSSNWALKSLKYLQKQSYKYGTNEKFSQYLKSYCNLLNLFIQHAKIGLEFTLFVDELTLINPGHEIFIEAFMKSILDEECPLVLDRVACLWGDKYFISQGNEAMQVYLTGLIIRLLHRIHNKDVLLGPGPRGISLISGLSTGVSAYFDITSKSSRRRAMEIAQLFSSKIGHDLKFDDLISEDSSDHQQKPHENTNTQLLNSFTRRNDNDDDQDIVESDASSELVPYDTDWPDEMNSIDSLSSNKLRSQPVYLRKSLELLRVYDTKPEAFESHRSALISIPKIVSSRPVDGHEVCPPLILELLRIQNAFNMEKFQVLQSEALQSLLVAYPSVAVPVIGQSLLDESMSLGGRMGVLTELTSAAHSLAGIDSTKTFESGLTGQSQEALKSLQREMAQELKQFSSLDGKTTVNRPQKFALYLYSQNNNTQSSNPNTKYFRNNFGPVAKQFYYPVVKLFYSYSLNLRPSGKSLPSYLEATNTAASDKTPSTANEKVEEVEIQPSSSSSLKHAVVKKPGTATVTGEDDDVYSLVIAQALLTLGAYVRCSINTPSQREFVMESLKIAAVFREVPSLTLRRSALSCLLSCVESWLLLTQSTIANLAHRVSFDGDNYFEKSALNTRKGTRNYSRYQEELTSSALNALKHISLDDSEAVASSGVDRELIVMIMPAIDWVIASLQSEVDPHSQILKLEIIRIAIRALEM